MTSEHYGLIFEPFKFKDAILLFLHGDLCGRSDGMDVSGELVGRV